MVFIDGEVVGAGEARVSVFDRGFLYGDSVFEVLRTYGGRPFRARCHLARLRRSAAAVGLDLPWGDAEITAAMDRTLASAANADSYVRIICSRGEGELGLDPGLALASRLVIIVRPLPERDPRLWLEGLSVVLLERSRGLAGGVAPGIKTGNYLGNIMALSEARGRGADDAIMLDEAGRLAEAPFSNVFVVERGVVRTPPLEAGILEGVTRAAILEVCDELGVERHEEHLWPEDLRRADEAFLSSSVREVAAVTRVDGEPLGSGLPGPLTRRLIEAFGRLARRTVEAG